MHPRLSSGLALVTSRLAVALTLMLFAPVGCLIGAEDQMKPLQIVTAIPTQGAAHPADTPLRLITDRYLDPTRDWAQAVQLTSGELRFAVEVGYDPVAPGLVIVPIAALRPGLGYTLTVFADSLYGLDGSQLEADLTLDFVAAVGLNTPEPAPLDFDTDVAPILTANCGCHGPDLPPRMTEADLLDQPSLVDPDRWMVRRGLPMQSTLILKVLDGYPHRLGQQMPPEGPPLDPERLRTLVTWVARR